MASIRDLLIFAFFLVYWAYADESTPTPTFAFDLDSRIVGGVDAAAGDYPFFGKLLSRLAGLFFLKSSLTFWIDCPKFNGVDAVLL